MATDNWTGGTASWTIPGDWSAGVPTMTSDVVIAQGQSCDPLVTSAISIDSLNVSGGEVDFNSAGSSAVAGSVTLSGNGDLHFDYDDNSGGGTSLAIGGALTLSGSFTRFAIGANTQSTGDTVTAASLSVATGLGS